MKETYNILWTGGLDSTFRITELSLYDCIVQPYYVVDQERLSHLIELKRINEILVLLRASKKTKAEIKDIITINIDDIKESEEITRSALILKEKYNLGLQYDWLSRYAYSNNLYLELSLENSPKGRATNVLSNEAKLKTIDAICPYYMVDENKSSIDAINVFGHFHIPCSLWSMTKEDEIRWFQNHGYFNIAKKTWFCHNPVWGLPCGNCNPCKDALNEGMGWRVPLTGRILYVVREYYWELKARIMHSFNK